jgi:hypothetical protein
MSVTIALDENVIFIIESYISPEECELVGDINIFYKFNIIEFIILKNALRISMSLFIRR